MWYHGPARAPRCRQTKSFIQNSIEAGILSIAPRCMRLGAILDPRPRRSPRGPSPQEVRVLVRTGHGAPGPGPARCSTASESCCSARLWPVRPPPAERVECAGPGPEYSDRCSNRRPLWAESKDSVVELGEVAGGAATAAHAPATLHDAAVVAF
jgi:hypothetical protein